jgi:hypothetical protein
LEEKREKREIEALRLRLGELFYGFIFMGKESEREEVGAAARQRVKR